MCQACASALAAWEARALRSTDTSLPRSGLSVRVATLSGAYSTSIMTEAVEGGNLGGQFKPGPIEARSPSVAPAGDGHPLRPTGRHSWWKVGKEAKSQQPTAGKMRHHLQQVALTRLLLLLERKDIWSPSTATNKRGRPDQTLFAPRQVQPTTC